VEFKNKDMEKQIKTRYYDNCVLSLHYIWHPLMEEDDIGKDGKQGNGPPKPRCEESCQGLGHMVMAQGRSLASALGDTPQHSRQKCMPSRHAQ
jgi:hypothetical protein